MPVPERRLTLALGTGTGLSLLGDAMLYVVLPSQPGVAGLTAAALGVVLSANRIVRLAANPLAGALYDRLDGRQPYVLAMALAAVSTLGYYLAHDFWPLLLARVIWGIAFALMTVGALTMLVSATSMGDRARAIGDYHALVHLWMLLAYVGSGVLNDLIGYRPTLAVLATLTLPAVAVAVAGVPRTPGGRPTLAEALRARGVRAPLESRGPRPAMTIAARLATLRDIDRRLVAGGFVSFAALFGTSGVLMATLGLLLRTELEASPGPALGVATATGVLLALRRAFVVVLSPLAGRLSDRLGDRERPAAAGAVVAVAGFGVLAIWPGLGAIGLGVLLIAVGEAVLLPPVAALGGDLAAPGARGAVMAGFATAADLGAALGPLVGYALATTLGLPVAYALCAVLLSAAVLALSLGRPRARSGWGS